MIDYAAQLLPAAPQLVPFPQLREDPMAVNQDASGVSTLWQPRGVAAALAVAVVTGACDGAPIGVGPPVTTRVAAGAVVGAAAVGLNASGQFTLTNAGGFDEISESQAREQAQGWIATFGKHRLPSLGRERGEIIEQATLKTCRQAYRAEPSLIAPPKIKPTLRRAFGPQWLVPLCSPSGRQAVLLAVSAYNTDVSVSNGRLVLPPLQGSQFKSAAVPGNVESLPISPEAAVNLAYEHTGIAVAEVPTLELPPRPIPAYEARWKIVLERPAILLAQQGGTVRVQELWIGTSSRTKNPSVAYAGGALDAISLPYTELGANQLRIGDIKEVVVAPRPGSVRWVTAKPTGGR